ncbi:hypothetical protein P8C59_003668 [Phyllachora maydis]|uniref:Uncharacterized protein n=1 Tax=Phyllachora maydis TaxID=1825666 RepID=A0AAD9MDK3_9PEZI|nr:hypothetical protein P8C59_003668 [Phyllachora maydis]
MIRTSSSSSNNNSSSSSNNNSSSISSNSSNNMAGSDNGNNGDDPNTIDAAALIAQSKSVGSRANADSAPLDSKGLIAYIRILLEQATTL